MRSDRSHASIFRSETFYGEINNFSGFSVNVGNTLRGEKRWEKITHSEKWIGGSYGEEELQSFDIVFFSSFIEAANLVGADKPSIESLRGEAYR